MSHDRNSTLLESDYFDEWLTNFGAPGLDVPDKASGPAEASFIAPEPVYTQDAHGSWIGTMPDGRRTMLKSTKAWAIKDVEAGRFVCPGWPACTHRDADECSRVMRRWRGKAI